MSKAFTFKDVTDIKPRSPLVEHPYDKSSRWNPKPIVLHIIDREGKVPGRDILGKPELHHATITRCKRVVDYWELSGWGEVNTAIKQTSKTVDPKHEVEFKFCSRCGTAQDFVDAMTEWDRAKKERDDAYKFEQEERKRLAEETWKRITDASFINDDMLRRAGIPTNPTKYKNERYYDTHIDGHDYRVTITLTSKPKDE